MRVRAWRALIKAFATGVIDASGFETQFLTNWRLERDKGAPVHPAVDQMYFAVESYCANPSLREATDLDAVGMRQAAKDCLTQFDDPWTVPPQGGEFDLTDTSRRAAAEPGPKRN